MVICTVERMQLSTINAVNKPVQVTWDMILGIEITCIEAVSHVDPLIHFRIIDKSNQILAWRIHNIKLIIKYSRVIKLHRYFHWGNEAPLVLFRVICLRSWPCILVTFCEPANYIQLVVDNTCSHRCNKRAWEQCSSWCCTRPSLFRFLSFIQQNQKSDMNAYCTWRTWRQ